MCGGQSKEVTNLGKETSLFPWMSICDAFFGDEVDGPAGQEDISNVNSGCPLQHSVPVEQAAERFDEVVERLSSKPSKLFLSMSDGHALGGQLPSTDGGKSFVEQWVDNAYYILDSEQSCYTVATRDRAGCCGTVHLELHPVRERVLRNRLQAFLDAVLLSPYHTTLYCA